MADKSSPISVRLGRRAKLQPHWALAMYMLALAMTCWAAFADDSLGHRHFVTFYDLTAGIIEFYAFLILTVINYRHDFILVGKLVLMAAIYLCVGLSLYIGYQFIMTLRSPSYKTIFLDTILDSRGYVTGSILPLAAATAVFIAIMLMATRIRPRAALAKAGTVIAIDPLVSESYEALPLDASAKAPGPFQSRRATDKPELKADDDEAQDWPTAPRQTSN
ncbi:MAG: hypothetical protein LBE49_04405 [Deltaproteobacteria bacterium]|nr:hypothetical protein [Deltaproteobacteria bacterium]